MRGELTSEGVDDSSAPEDARRFFIPADHIETLTSPSDASHVLPLGRMVVGVANALADVVSAYRTREGVPYPKYGADFRDGQGGVNRPAFETDLVENWLRSVPGVDAMLNEGGRVADVGCGQGRRDRS